MGNQGRFVWHELVTSDQQRSGEFFSQLFGWKRKETDAGEFAESAPVIRISYTRCLAAGLSPDEI